MKKKVFGALIVSTLAASSWLALAVPASATPTDTGITAMRCIKDYFCAWEHINYGGNQLVGSRAPRGSKVDVADNQVSSGSNNTSNNWKGMSRRSGLPDQNVFTWAPFSEHATIGSANDKIDHFDVA